jgi:hypothetical protein
MVLAMEGEVVLRNIVAAKLNVPRTFILVQVLPQPRGHSHFGEFLQGAKFFSTFGRWRS